MQEAIDLIVLRALKNEGLTHSDLLTAIQSKDKDAFKKALDECTDVNMGHGAPLLIAAALDEFNFCQALFLRGAGMNLALYNNSRLNNEYYGGLAGNNDNPYKQMMRTFFNTIEIRLTKYNSDFKNFQIMQADQNRTRAIQSIADQIGLFRETMMELFGDKNQKPVVPQSTPERLPQP